MFRTILLVAILCAAALGLDAEEHRRSHHAQGTHDAMKEEMRANLVANCAQDMTNNFCDGTECPRKQLKCLAEVEQRLSPVCAEFVTTTTAAMQERHHGHDEDHENIHFARAYRFRMIGWTLAALMLLIGLVWGYFERKRRNSLIGERQAKIGSYFSSLCECFSRPFVCIPACLFTPVLAAFNRAEADDRECNTCDVCFALLKPVAQYTTRQTIRGKYNMRDENCSDCCSAVCCTPCDVAQDTLELEKRAPLQTAPKPMTAPGMPVYVIAAQAPPSADMSMSKIDKADEQVYSEALYR